MKNLVFIAVSLVIIIDSAFAAGYAYSFDDILDVTDEFFTDNLTVYRGKYDIVDILYPINELNPELSENNKAIYFFVLADIQTSRTEYKGLYVSKNAVVTKLLDNGRVSAAAVDGTKNAYFGATDGLYSYDAETNTAKRFGTIKDHIISLVKAKGEDTLYILNNFHALYKVTNMGTKKQGIYHTIYYQDIVLDSSNNLYFSTPDNRVHIVGRDGVRQVQGLPTFITYFKIYKAPFFVPDAIALIANELSHLVFFNGTVGVGHCRYHVKPTAYSLQPLLLQQYGYKKNIYQLNFITNSSNQRYPKSLRGLVTRRASAIQVYSVELYELV